MCWIGKCDLKIAEEDIPIFKVLYKSNNLLYSEKTFISMYQNFPYTLNKEVESEIQVEPWKNICVVFKALHSYDPKSTSFTKISGTRIHLYHNDSNSFLENFFIDDCVKISGIIPKGSTYALNDTGEYISDKIILKEVEFLDKTLFEVSVALHSYNPEKVKCLRNSSMIYIEGPIGFDGPKKLDWFDVDKDIIRVEGIIPKGSKYMENIDGEYVSNQLILKHIELI